jgi:hypothetical protein
MKTHSFFSFMLLALILLVSCTQSANLAIPQITATSNIPQTAVTSTEMPTFAAITGTPIPTMVTSRTSPPPTQTPELLTCRESPQQTETALPVKLLYVNENRVLLWDEASGEKMQIQLPTNATDPQISGDGRFIAFLLQGQAYDTAEKAVESIPLWLLDRKSGQARQVASFQTTETRNLYPQAPQILLEMQWLPGGHWLLVEVYPVPWGEGTLQPTGDLFLVNADTGLPQRLLKGGEYAYYSIRPDGKQIAVLSTAAMLHNGTMDHNAIQKGILHLIGVPPEGGTLHLQIRLTENPWTISPPVYSPDGSRMALQVEDGLAIVDAQSIQVQQIPLINPCATTGCYSGGPFMVIWQPDSMSFYTLTYRNDYFDSRAETALHLIQLEPAFNSKIFRVIHAAPWTFSFSPNRQILSYWNQADLDTPEGDLNWVTLYLIDLQQDQPGRYTAEFLLRLIGWSPDGQRFLYSYSPFRGPSPIAERLALGCVCQPPMDLWVPEGEAIGHVRWYDSTRFLAWTLPSEGIPKRYITGLYMYSLAGGRQPTHIDDQLQDRGEPYGMQSQVVVLEK